MAMPSALLWWNSCATTSNVNALLALAVKRSTLRYRAGSDFEVKPCCIGQALPFGVRWASRALAIGVCQEKSP
jgi:hypothetical protein